MKKPALTIPRYCGFFNGANMRFLSLIFFIFLSLHSYFVFSQDNPPLSCNGTPSTCRLAIQLQFLSTNCHANGSNFTWVTAAPDDCPDGSAVRGNCLTQCVCPEGYRKNTVQDANGIISSECLPDTPTETPDGCPGGYPTINGQCPDSACGENEVIQGYVNNLPICQGTCSGGGSWGSVNGVEGCYDESQPSCPNGGSYGTVNGVSGCYGDDGSGSGSNSSGGAGGSSGSNTSGGAGGSSGSNTSSGSGGGDSGGGNNGGGGGGSGNNSVGVDYPEQQSCPEGFVKEGTKCVTEGRGDCPVNYHEVVISHDPFIFWCVPDDDEQSSSSPPSSSSQSSQNSSSNSNASTGGGSGSSSGSGGSGGGGDGSTGAGDCDPTAADYFKCAGVLEEADQSDIQDIYDGIETTNKDSSDAYDETVTEDLQDFAENESGLGDSPSMIRSVLMSFLPVSTPCVPPTITIFGRTHNMSCDWFNVLKQAFGWFLAVLTAFNIWQLAIRPVER